MPSAVRVETLGRRAAFLFRIGADKRAAALSGQTANFENAQGVSNGWVNVYGRVGMHKFASLCGERVRAN